MTDAEARAASPGDLIYIIKGEMMGEYARVVPPGFDGGLLWVYPLNEKVALHRQLSPTRGYGKFPDRCSTNLGCYEGMAVDAGL
jgi:hypothetical protein